MVRSVKQAKKVKQSAKPATKPAKAKAPKKPVKAPPKAKAIAKPKKTVTQKTTRKVVPKKASKPAKPAKPVKPAVKVAKASPAPKAPKAPKPAKVPSGPKGYTPAEYAKFKDFKEQFQEKSNQQLKDLLRANLQSMSGNKDELIYKCADGATLGRIPRCPKCFGGRPKFDHQKGTYYCSGYRDDEDFKNCHSTFQLSEITRDAWTN